MKQFLHAFVEGVVWKVLVLILTPLAALLGGKIQSGDWLKWFRLIPLSAVYWFVGVMVTLIALGLLIRRISYLREANLPALPVVYSMPMFGYTRAAELKHNGVFWRILLKNPPPWENLTVGESLKTQPIEIETPPVCPRCKTELEETQTLFGRYKWSCIRCGFSTKNRISYIHEAVRVERLARSMIENDRL